MREHLRIWIAGGIVAITTTASAVLNLVTAVSISDIQKLSASKAFFFFAFALQLAALGCLAYLSLFFIKQLGSSTTKRGKWAQYWTGALFHTIVATVTCVALIWLTTRQHDLKQKHYGLVTAGFVVWALYVLSLITFFTLLLFRTKKILDIQVPCTMVSNMTTIQTPTKQINPGPRSSFCSRDVTSASRACTPTSSRTYSLHSSTTKVGSSIRSKFRQGRSSAQSSFELTAFSTGEARSISPNAFDRYDTSNIDPDTRNTILGSSPTINRSGLEPIPGSRSNTPHNSLDEVPAVPDVLRSPHTPSPPRNKLNAIDTIPPSPPSSPPNFSRPTSRSQHRSIMTGVEAPPFSASMTDLIHPLFRPGSPCTPKIMTTGTMVTASPLANQPITPKTLSRLRSDSQLRLRTNMSAATIAIAATSARESMGQWRTMPNVEVSYAAVMARPRAKSHSSVSKRPGTTQSTPELVRPLTRTDNASMGSPGPSIIDDDDLPPILPGFVLSAGCRSSLVGYDKRKSVKNESSHLA